MFVLVEDGGVGKPAIGDEAKEKGSESSFSGNMDSRNCS